MICVGIDVSSEKHNFMIMNHEALTYSNRSIVIPNNYEGYEKLHKSIQEFCGANNDFEVRIGFESTSFFHSNILNFLVKNKYDVMIINPCLISDYKKGKKVHSAKNDNLDAIAICNYLDDSKNEFIPYTPLSYHKEALKSLSRERITYIKKLSKEKLHVYRLLTLIFPEYLQLFTNVYQGSAKAIITKYLNPVMISKARISSLDKMIHGGCQTSAAKLHEIASKSVGNSADYLSFELKQAYETLDFLQSSIDKLDSQIKKLVDSANTKILTIPGVGYTTAALILGELGDVNRFKSPDSIVAYTGIDNIIYESGKYEAKSTYTTKKGSRYLRLALFQVAQACWQHDPQFNKYYQKKKAENKHHFVILGHIMKKLIRVIYSVLKNDKEYFIPQN